MPMESIKFSKEVAETIGLNEAVLVTVLEDLQHNKSTNKFKCSEIVLQTKFWNRVRLEEVLKSLENKGLINCSEDLTYVTFLKFKKESIVKANISFEERSSRKITEEWEPETQLIEQASDYGIPARFVLDQLEEFKYFWLEKNELHHSWGLKFLRHVIKAWRKNEIKENNESKKILMHEAWFPDEDALDILVRAGINIEFINETISEFILYWTEKGSISDTWNSKFIAHVRRQWEKSQNLIENYNQPQTISAKWTPSAEFYDVLSLSSIEQQFADNLIPEFIMYWQEEGKAHNSWNSKFFQHVKYQWQKKVNENILPKDIEKRVESSWKIEPAINKEKKLPLSKENQEVNRNKFNKLKTKHNI